MRKIIDGNGRLFGLISFIDVIVLVAVIVLAVASFTKFNVHDNPLTATGTTRVTYTVEVHAMSYTAANLLRPGDLLHTDSGIYIGTITDVSIADAKWPEPLVDGSYVMANVHERYDATLTVEVQASFNSGRYFADRLFELNANTEQRMTTKYNTFTGFIITITVE